jgi:site-specific DNA recombinase
LRHGIAWLIDRDAEGPLEKSDFEPRITRLKQRIVRAEAKAKQLADKATLQADLRSIIGRLEAFATQVKTGLHQADWLTRRELMRTLVKRVEVDQQYVKVVRQDRGAHAASERTNPSGRHPRQRVAGQLQRQTV